jgi:hypothetical protein
MVDADAREYECALVNWYYESMVAKGANEGMVRYRVSQYSIQL